MCVFIVLKKNEREGINEIYKKRILIQILTEKQQQ